MNTEQKAKIYDDTVNKLRRFMEQGIDPLITRANVQDFFPDFKESEDERIRKEIQSVIEQLDKDTTICGKKYDYNQWITWLDKQGEQKTQVKSAIEIWKDMRFEVYQQASGNRHEPNYSDDSTKMFSLNDIDEIIEKINEQKLTDKVEPKFHEGDWIVDDCGYVWKIKGILNQFYELECVEGCESLPTIECVDETFHLWTIKDAKSGDVLFHSDSASNGIFIFKELLKYEFSEKVICYCDYDSEDHFCLGEHHTCCWSDAKILHPATNEQRALLFQKMKEAGYEWDDKNKELKKIEQKPVCSKDDEEMINNIIDYMMPMPLLKMQQIGLNYLNKE